MENVPHPITVKLEGDVADASKREEDDKWQGLEDAIQLSAMVAEHNAALLPQLPPHAPP
jgi:hypothetical protein